MAEKCSYCDKPATTEDAMGVEACAEHEHASDEYYERMTGKKPNEDDFKYCPNHLDLWKPGCLRCEQCCQHHYGKLVIEVYPERNKEYESTEVKSFFKRK